VDLTHKEDRNKEVWEEEEEEIPDLPFKFKLRRKSDESRFSGGKIKDHKGNHLVNFKLTK
jgi:hypothetical protein